LSPLAEATRWTIACLMMASLHACTSMKPVDSPPAELAAKIRQGGVLHVGDEVTIVTRDGQKKHFKVTGIDDDMVRGDKENVAIDDVAALQTKEISLGNTALLAGGVVGSLYVILIIAGSLLVLAAA
jgi:predicted small lipoprotein YifL